MEIEIERLQPINSDIERVTTIIQHELEKDADLISRSQLPGVRFQVGDSSERAHHRVVIMHDDGGRNGLAIEVVEISLDRVILTFNMFIGDETDEFTRHYVRSAHRRLIDYILEIYPEAEKYPESSDYLIAKPGRPREEGYDASFERIQAGDERSDVFRWWLENYVDPQWWDLRENRENWYSAMRYRQRGIGGEK